MDLANGNFVAGKDFPAGVYDITAISGTGNVSSDNMHHGGLNAIMGVTGSFEPYNEIYERSYKNIELPEGVILSISGVKIQLTPSK